MDGACCGALGKSLSLSGPKGSWRETPSPRRCGGSRAPRVEICVTGILCVTLTSEQTASIIQMPLPL